MLKKRILLLVLVLAALAVLPTLASEESRYETIMSQVVTSINTGAYDAVYALFNGTAAARSPKEVVVQALSSIVVQMGKITKTSPAEVVSSTGATFVLVFEKGIIDAQLVLDSSGLIASLNFSKRAEAESVPSRQVTALRLPFDGAWYTKFGGDYSKPGHVSQRYAYIFVVRDASGSTHKGDGKKNEDYYAFGRKVLAPAAGVITDVFTGVRDNVPGKPNPFMQLGNAVIIKHANGECSILANLKYGSIVVKVGAKISSGQLIGLCGNSGLITEPGLHFAVMNKSDLIQATGIRALFKKIKVVNAKGTKVMADYLPEKGDTVSAG